MSSIKAIDLDHLDLPAAKKKNIFFAQFKYSKGARLRHRLKELKWDFIYAFERAVYGYEPTAVFALDSIFIERYIEILNQFKGGHSHPGDMTYEEWQSNIDTMIGFLKIMQEDEFNYAEKLPDGNYDWEAMKQFKEKKEQAKNEFFELFSLFFFDLWD